MTDAKATCPSCGRLWTDHAGIATTCRNATALRAMALELRALALAHQRSGRPILPATLKRIVGPVVYQTKPPSRLPRGC